MKLPRILFFVNGPAPSSKEFAMARNLGADVVFRNALHVPAEGSLEFCDGVAGEVPARYSATYSTAKQAIAKYLKNAEIEDAKFSSEEKPPKIKTAAELEIEAVVKAAADASLEAEKQKAIDAAILAAKAERPETQIAPNVKPSSSVAWKPNATI